MNVRESAAQACDFEDDDAYDDARAARDGAAFSVGRYLAGQRRLRGLSLDELEAATRIPRRSLARLEAGAFDQQQDAFVRGFVRTVAGAIGVDPCDTLVRMIEAEPVPAGRGRERSWSVAGAGLLAVLLLAGSAGLLLGLRGPWQATGDRARIAAAEAAVAAGAAAAAAPEGVVPGAVPEPAVSIRRDPVRILAERVREATPGSFSSPRPAAPPPAMYVAPAPDVALDAIFARTDPWLAALPAVSAGPR